MSVYTTVSKDELDLFLDRYAIGALADHQGISAGITNTNYALTTKSGDFILTLFEQISSSEVGYILGLQHHLAGKEVRCASPVLDQGGLLFSELNNRPAAIVHRISGSICKTPSARQCGLIGAELALFHLAGKDYIPQRPNPRGIAWCNSMQEKLAPVLDEPDKQLLRNELGHLQSQALDKLPRGAIHADLFHDNVLFDIESIGGIIDFDYACEDILVLDLGVAINDWCISEDGSLETGKVDALLEAYHRIRPLQKREYEALPLVLRFAALRFWLSRLYDKTYPISGELTFVKNPDEFRSMLVLRQNQPFEFA